MYKPLYIIAGNLIWLSTANSSNVSAEIKGCGLFGVSQNEVLIPVTRLEWNPDIFFLIVTVEQSLVVARIAANGK